LQFFHVTKSFFRLTSREVFPGIPEMFFPIYIRAAPHNIEFNRNDSPLRQFEVRAHGTSSFLRRGVFFSRGFPSPLSFEGSGPKFPQERRGSLVFYSFLTGDFSLGVAPFLLRAPRSTFFDSFFSACRLAQSFP